MKTFKLLLVSSVLLLFSCNVLDVTLESESFPLPGKVKSNQTTVFNDQIWTIINDFSGFPDIEQEVWSTPDGINWSLRRENPFPNTRYSITVFSYDGKLWAFSTTAGSRNDIRNSSDGISWELVAEGGGIPFELDNVRLATVFNNKIVIFTSENSGIGPDFDGTRVYSSTDGINWTLDTNETDMNLYFDRFTINAFNDFMYVIGSSRPYAFSGEIVPPEREIWRSPNGPDWWNIEYARDDYIFPAMWKHSSVVYSDHLFVIGGEFESYDPTSEEFVPSRLTDDIWYTNDAREWRKYSGNTPFNGVKEHTTVNFNGKIWLFGGKITYRRGDGSISVRNNTEVWSIVFND